MAREKQFGDSRLEGDMRVAACLSLVSENRRNALESLKKRVVEHDMLTNSRLLAYVPFYELYLGDTAEQLANSAGFYDGLLRPENVLDGLTLENISISRRPSEDPMGDKVAEGVVILRRKDAHPEHDDVTRLRVKLQYEEHGYGFPTLKSSSAERI